MNEPAETKDSRYFERAARAILMMTDDKAATDATTQLIIAMAIELDRLRERDAHRA